MVETLEKKEEEESERGMGQESIRAQKERATRRDEGEGKERNEPTRDGLSKVQADFESVGSKLEVVVDRDRD